MSAARPYTDVQIFTMVWACVIMFLAVFFIGLALAHSGPTTPSQSDKCVSSHGTVAEHDEGKLSHYYCIVGNTVTNTWE